MKQVMAASHLASNTTFNGIQANTITPNNNNNNDLGSSQISFNNSEGVPAPPPGFENPPCRAVNMNNRGPRTVIRIKRVDETKQTNTVPIVKNLKNNIGRALTNLSTRMSVIRENLSTWMHRTENCSMTTEPNNPTAQKNQMKLKNFQKRQQQVSLALVQNLPKDLGQKEQMPGRIISLEGRDRDDYEGDDATQQEVSHNYQMNRNDDMSDDDYQATPIEVRHAHHFKSTRLSTSAVSSSSPPSTPSGLSVHTNGTKRTESSNHCQFSSKWMMRGDMPSPTSNDINRSYLDATSSNSSYTVTKPEATSSCNSNSAYTHMPRIAPGGPPNTGATRAATNVKYSTPVYGSQLRTPPSPNQAIDSKNNSPDQVYYHTPINAKVNAYGQGSNTGPAKISKSKLIIREDDARVSPSRKPATASHTSSGKIIVFKRSKLKTPTLPTASKDGPVCTAMGSAKLPKQPKQTQNEDDLDSDRILTDLPVKRVRQSPPKTPSPNACLSAVAMATANPSFEMSTSSLSNRAEDVCGGSSAAFNSSTSSSSSIENQNSSSSSSNDLTSGASNSSQSYYQRTSACVNFSHMLYDIPEEEADMYSSDDSAEEKSEETDNDVESSSNYAGILKI